MRDRLTWLCYLMLSNQAFFAASLGPLMPFIRDELGISYTIAALHFSIWSLGTLLAGSMGDFVMQKLGKSRAVWSTATMVSLAAVIIYLAKFTFLTLFACFVAGFAGSIMGQSLCTIMAERFLEFRAIALTEANIAGSLCCSLSPLVVAFLIKSDFNWRMTLIFPILTFLLLFLILGKALPKEELAGMNQKFVNESLPIKYWLCWLVIFFTVASEWSVIYWAADFIAKIIHIPKADASASVTVFLLAMVLGRFLGSRLARFMDPSLILRISAVLLLPGFIIFWLPSCLVMNLFGLFILGLGIANFYPFTMSIAISTSPLQTAKATSRLSLSTGSCTLVTPLVLGFIAEKSNIGNAFVVIGIFLLVTVLLVFLPIFSSSCNPGSCLNTKQSS